MTRRKGFTLVEILVNILIIVILAAIMTPLFLRTREKSRRNDCINNLGFIDHAKQQLATAVQTMTDSYVPAMSELQPYMIRNLKDSAGVPICRSGGTYSINAITNVPTCSKGPSLQHYRCSVVIR